MLYFGEAMTDEALLQLALQACQDRTAQAVLGDAVLESGWSDARVIWLLGRWERPSYAGYFSGMAPSTMVRTRTVRRAANLSRKHARNPSQRWCRAVAAALLVGDWGYERWPGVESSRVESPDAYEFRIGMYGELSSPGTLFGINRSPDPLRLAGHAVVTSIDRGNGTITFGQSRLADIWAAETAEASNRARRIIDSIVYGSNPLGDYLVRDSMDTKRRR